MMHSVQRAREGGLTLFRAHARVCGPDETAQLALALNLLTLTENERLDLMIRLEAAIRPDAPQKKWLTEMHALVRARDFAAFEASVRSQIDATDSVDYP